MTNENDNPWIKDRDNWSNWHYDGIKSMLDNINVGAIHDYADAWNAAGGSLGDTVGEFIAKLGQAIDGHWSGSAADQARAVLNGYQALPSVVRPAMSRTPWHRPGTRSTASPHRSSRTWSTTC